MENFDHVFSRHERIAFQFSGGKDSTAALFLLRTYWDRLTVYFCDSGDSMPETLEVVENVSKQIPNFVVIKGRVIETKAQFGLPTDLLPWTSSAAAHALNTGSTQLMQDRVHCCFHSVMKPMHERMLEDKVTLIIRGQKSADEFKGSLKSGDVCDGIEFLYPVQDWTDEDCFAYMRQHGVEPQRFYSEELTHSGDCIGCTAWCEENDGRYLREYHPEAFQEYRKNMRIIADAVQPAMLNFVRALDESEV